MPGLILGYFIYNAVTLAAGFLLRIYAAQSRRCIFNMRLRVLARKFITLIDV